MDEKKQIISDEEAVILARQGDPSYEELLINRYKTLVKIRGGAFFIAGADRDDVIQEGMIGLFKAIRSFEPGRGAAFSTFAELCIDRQIMTAIKNAGRLKHSPLNLSVSLDHPAGDDDEADTIGELIPDTSSADPEELFLIGEKLDDLERNGQNILSQLEWYVWKAHMNGRNYVEIGEELKKPPKAIDNALQRARKKLDAWLSE